MYHTERSVMIVNAINTRAVRKLPLYHSTFSETGGTSCVQAAMYQRLRTKPVTPFPRQSR